MNEASRLHGGGIKRNAVFSKRFAIFVSYVCSFWASNGAPEMDRRGRRYGT
jgi:hypothetical protein